MAKSEKKNLEVSLSIVNVCLSVLFAVGKGKIFPTPWVEWTPMGDDGKALAKRAVEGVVDVNRILRGTTIVKPADKTLAAKLMQSWLTKSPKEGMIVGSGGNGTPVSHVLAAGITVGETLMRLVKERGVKAFHHYRNFEWSGTNKEGQTVFGIGEDWPLFQKRWNDCKADVKAVEKLYGYLPWGQPIMSQANILSLYDKGKEAKYDLVEYVKSGRGKKAKIVVTSGFDLAEFESLAESFKPKE